MPKKLRAPRVRQALDALSLTRLHHVLAPITRGSGVVFTLHHVRPFGGASFAPNRILEITPEFLEMAVRFVRESGYDIVTLDEAIERLGSKNSGRFAAFTFDDGFRSVRDHALPIMRKYGAHSTLFVVPAFADGTGQMWWLELERTIAAMPVIEFQGEAFDTSTTERKYAAWNALYWRLRAMDELEMRAAISALAENAGVDTSSIARDQAMDWDELRGIVDDPLVSIGNHTVSHYMLRKHADEVARSEIVDAQARIARELNVVPRHIAYPVGDPTSAGTREFRMARDLGFTGGWTTRLGPVFPGHRRHTTAMPRVSLNGLYQERRYLELFVSGLPFALKNRFRRLNVA